MAETDRGYPIFTGGMAPAGPVQMQQLAEAIDADVQSLADTRHAAGRVAVGILVAGGFTSVNVTYPVGRFTVQPIVVQATGNSRLTTSVLSETKDGFIYGVHNHTGVASEACSVMWLATQMTATTAAG